MEKIEERRYPTWDNDLIMCPSQCYCYFETDGKKYCIYLRWRFDYAIPKHKVAIEIDGAVWTMGRHNRPEGYINDMEKLNTATSMGWLVLRFTTDDRLKESTLRLIKETISIRSNGDC